MSKVLNIGYYTTKHGNFSVKKGDQSDLFNIELIHFEKKDLNLSIGNVPTMALAFKLALTSINELWNCYYFVVESLYYDFDNKAKCQIDRTSEETYFYSLIFYEDDLQFDSDSDFFTSEKALDHAIAFYESFYSDEDKLWMELKERIQKLD